MRSGPFHDARVSLPLRQEVRLALFMLAEVSELCDSATPWPHVPETVEAYLSDIVEAFAVDRFRRVFGEPLGKFLVDVRRRVQAGEPETWVLGSYVKRQVESTEDGLQALAALRCIVQRRRRAARQRGLAASSAAHLPKQGGERGGVRA